MIKRIVRLTFEADKVKEFMTIFEENRLNIRRFPGCNHLEVWREKANPNVFRLGSLSTFRTFSADLESDQKIVCRQTNGLDRRATRYRST